jgi:hypothetical protein
MSYDDLNEINLESKTTLLSNVYRVQKGGFGVRTNGTRTYLSSAIVENLLEDVSTFETITKDKSWPVSQIIQREIDNRRIKDISSDYILRDREIKYFPPILIAILPKEGDGLSNSYQKKSETTSSEKLEIYKKFGTDDEKLKRFFIESNDNSKADGLFILDIFPKIKINFLVWDPSKYFAIVIDGQHRLDSLKNSVKVNSAVSKFIQDVAFLDLSEVCMKSKSLTPIKAVRTLFLDINNTSEPVSKARKCLMDDKDLASLFVQQILDDTEEHEHEYIKPQIVDWHSENLKHQLPHLTGVLVLHQLMSDTILNNVNIVTIDDQRNENKVEKWKRLLNDRFKVDEQISKLEKFKEYSSLSSSYKEYIEEITEDDGNGNEEKFSSILFKYDYGVLKVATHYFNENYINSIIYFFNSFRPHSKAINILKERGAFDPAMRINRILTKNPKKLDKDENKLLNELKSAIEDRLNKNYFLLYSVLGQKAFFKFYFNYLIEESGGNFTNEVLLNKAKKIIEKINVLLEICDSNTSSYLFGEKESMSIPTKLQKKYNIDSYGKHASSFWDGIIYDGNNIIYNSRGIISFNSVLDYVWDFMVLNEFGDSNTINQKNYQDFDPGWAKNRIKRFIQRDFEITEENELERIVNNIILCKAEFLNTYLVNSIDLWKTSK